MGYLMCWCRTYWYIYFDVLRDWKLCLRELFVDWDVSGR